LNSQERIAKALEEKNEIIMGILYGLLAVSLLVAGFFLVMIFGQSVYDFFIYDLLGNERPAPPTYATIPTEPIDDCSFSDDKQLCHQMERIANILDQRESYSNLLLFQSDSSPRKFTL